MFIPGNGMFAPTRAMNKSASVKKIFCRSSGIFKEFVNAENISLDQLGPEGGKSGFISPLLLQFRLLWFPL